MAVGCCDMCEGADGCLECACVCHTFSGLEEEVQALREAPCSSCTEYKSTIQALHVELEIAAADNDRTRRERDDAMVELEKLRR
jgi:hypothetical protein